MFLVGACQDKVTDPQITAFLSCWVYEELWHGEAFSDFLRAYGIEVPAEPKLPDGSVPTDFELAPDEMAVIGKLARRNGRVVNAGWAPDWD